jgi:hypothetical protein
MPIFRGRAALGLSDFKASVAAASISNVNISGTVTSLDGVTLAEDDRILLTGQTLARENGIYTVSSSNAISRAKDADSSAEVSAGMQVYVDSGNNYGKTTWVLTTTGTITPGTTNLTFEKVSQIKSNLSGNYGGADKTITLTVNNTGLITALTEHSLDSSGYVTKTGTQTLTNKTLTAPTITNASIDSTTMDGGSF